MAVRRSLFWSGKPKERLSRGEVRLGNRTVPGTGAAGCIERYLSGHNGGSPFGSGVLPTVLRTRKMGDAEIVRAYSPKTSGARARHTRRGAFSTRELIPRGLGRKRPEIAPGGGAVKA